MEHIFRNYFDGDEKALAVALARTPGAAPAAGAAASGLSPRAALALERLAARNYLQLEPGGRCGFRIGLLAAWFRQWSKFAEMVETYTP